MAEQRLPPFPDELVETPSKERAIAFLRGLGLPSRIMAEHLSRWGQVTGVFITPDDIRRIRGDLRPPGA